MNARSVLKAAIQIVNKAPKTLNTEIPPKKVAEDLEDLIGWISPDLECRDIVKVVRCKHCAYYRRFKKKGEFKSVPFYACKLDMSKRDPEFYCKDGVARETEG